MQAPRRNLFIPIPAAVTGDLWHLAAAQILWQRYRPDQPGLVTVILTTDRGASDEVSHGMVTFNYLKQLHLPCMVVKISGLPRSPSKKLVERAIYDRSIDLQAMWDNHEGVVGQDHLFLEEVQNCRVSNLTEEIVSNRLIFPTQESNILQLMTATTIAIEILCESKTLFDERRNYLGERMVPPLDDKEQVVEKFMELVACIKDKGVHKKSAVLLYLNRINNQANAGTNSTEEIKSQLQQIATQRNMVFQVVAAGSVLEPGDFDIFSRKKSQGYPGVEPRYTAQLWRMVKCAANPAFTKEFNLEIPIFGVFSSRSGSVDLPAFCGVNCFFWDEPWLQATSDEHIFSWLSGATETANDPSRKFAKMLGQIPQCLRALQLYPIMATGVVETLESTGDARRVRLRELHEWLDGKNPGEVFPKDAPGRPWSTEYRGMLSDLENTVSIAHPYRRYLAIALTPSNRKQFSVGFAENIWNGSPGSKQPNLKAQDI
ncbi:hypothetical protein AA0119_g12861 [Alternaria tenuissima]|uniref:Uncharacterized protein n=1 Tax=Alternaria tenuissima TaxID=119927 RepID=A0ABY0FRW2_9PLEO|nr:hypothetical protein AA0119_g12861 [Alternaria tenuissima]RYO02843.1 hypothetical protein AA0121_g13230 [Alternaria tenuissima]